MSRKVEFPDGNDLIRRYHAGESMKEIAVSRQVSLTVLTRYFDSRGVKRRSIKRDIPNVQELIDLYLSGVSEYRIAIQSGISRVTLKKLFVKHGVSRRGCSEAGKLNWQSMGPEARAKQVVACHAASKGAVRRLDTKARIAKTRQAKVIGQSVSEVLLIELLESVGLTGIPQFAVGPYNLDIALDASRIAVEIFGGNFHCTGRHAARHLERTKYLLNLGWTVVVVWVDGTRHPLQIGCAEYIHSLANQIGGNQSSRGEYRVILGNGKPAPVAKCYLNTDSVIQALGSSHDITHRQHEIAG